MLTEKWYNLSKKEFGNMLSRTFKEFISFQPINVFLEFIFRNGQKLVEVFVQILSLEGYF